MQRAFIFSSVVLLAADIVCVLGATSDANSSFASLHKDRRSDEDLNSSSFSADETSKINPTAGNTSSAALVSIKLSYADSAEAESAADGIQAAFTLNQEPMNRWLHPSSNTLRRSDRKSAEECHLGV
eukprot:gene11934-5474_t